MLGDDLRVWFELFHGIAVYRPQPGGGHAFDGWLNWSDIENHFRSKKLTFLGKQYDPQDEAQRNQLLEAFINYAGTFVFLRLLERCRQIDPPSLDYRVTPFGRRVGNWGYGPKPGFKKRAFFFITAALLRAYRFRAIIAVGAAGWALLNAVRFYTSAVTWVSGIPFAAWSAAAVAAIIAVWVVIKSKLE